MGAYDPNDKVPVNRAMEISKEDLDKFDTLAGIYDDPWFNNVNNLPPNKFKLREKKVQEVQELYNEITKKAECVKLDYKKHTGLDMPLETAFIVALFKEIEILSDEVERYKEALNDKEVLAK